MVHPMHCGGHSGQSMPFVIRRLDTAMYKVNPQIPSNIFHTNCFLYLLEGEVFVDVGTEPFLVGAGEFLLIPPGVSFSIKYYNGSKGYMGAFSNEILKSSHFTMLHRRQPSRILIPFEDKSLMDVLVERLCREFRPSAAPGSILLSALDLMLEQLEILGKETGGYVGNPICARFLDKVFDRARVLESVSVYASELGVSANHLNRVVKTETGRSAGDWIDVSRLTLAKLLLRQTDMSVIDIASRAGFEDQSYFSRFFKKHTGVTPSEFRTEIVDV